jgi:Rrf2 family protein
MKLTTTEEYGLRCLLQVARVAPPGGAQLASIRDVADAEGLSPDYVAKLLGHLRKAGLVQSTRGANGGYALARDAGSITASEALRAFDTPFFGEGFCTSHKGQLECCIHKAHTSCSLTSLWNAVGTALDDVLSHVSLADLLEDTRSAPIDVPTDPGHTQRVATGGTHG